MRLLALVFAATVLGAAAHPAAADPPRPLYYDRALTPADLQGRTLRELTLMRNTVYARAGHPFRKKWLRDYFTAYSSGWMGTPTPTVKELLGREPKSVAEFARDFAGALGKK